MINFIRFSRPHTVIGTTLSISTLYLLALGITDSTDWYLGIFGLSLISCLGANIYIVGLNQITDVAIDRINKPYLPLASGAYSMRTGYWIIGISVLLSLGIALYLGRYLLLTVVLSLLLGTAYSLPPFRLKRFHFWAAFCIIAVRGLIVNLLLFLHFQYTINGSTALPAAIWLLTGTIFIYSIVIAWFKDIPDMEGDRQYQINTLSLRLGPKKVFRIGNGLILTAYLLVIIFAIQFDLGLSAPVLVISHLAFSGLLVWAGQKVDLFQREAVFQYYQFIWVLFFLEYAAFASAGLVGG
ncbi:homogentisate phytyltransferase [Flavilitoribacter nigricans]|uniref:Homogentisate phytyltransferase n=1 Tax=Flavilitoribacter nigricans (strain ATCC 23147 / DSM 23189 / NBRC 102662 / NCIMB 1420 / SS-2) TaxID=1122177 RepID=A0A2D0NF21_FLAN2|nr:homogentisate phytyltransferase [Flavilitoribacter nigricans]PHN07111.1 homogentisate phytyltransferase [Flavilitoribacter nigricans DSM 23189 = NBRC 102662]